MTIYTFYTDSKPEFVVLFPCCSGAAGNKAPLTLLVAYRLAVSAQVHSKLVRVVQASTTLPRRCRQAPGSTEGASRLQVLPRRCRQVLLSPRRCRQVSPLSQVFQ
jgi:hypothetical protein